MPSYATRSRHYSAARPSLGSPAAGLCRAGSCGRRNISTVRHRPRRSIRTINRCFVPRLSVAINFTLISGCSCASAGARARIFTSCAIFASVIHCARLIGGQPHAFRNRYHVNTRKNAISRWCSCLIVDDACEPRMVKSVISTMRSTRC